MKKLSKVIINDVEIVETRILSNERVLFYLSNLENQTDFLNSIKLDKSSLKIAADLLLVSKECCRIKKVKKTFTIEEEFDSREEAFDFVQDYLEDEKAYYLEGITYDGDIAFYKVKRHKVNDKKPDTVVKDVETSLEVLETVLEKFLFTKKNNVISLSTAV